MMNFLNAESQLETESSVDDEQGHDTTSEDSVLQRKKQGKKN